MRTDRNAPDLRELTEAETEEVAGGATTFVIAAPRTVATQQLVIPRTALTASSSVFFPRFNPGRLAGGGTVCW